MRTMLLSKLQYLSLTENEKNKLINELINNFNNQELESVLRIFNDTTGPKQIFEMNFYEERKEFLNNHFRDEVAVLNLLNDIAKRDDNLQYLKNYIDFRTNNNSLDFIENIVNSIYEYQNVGEFYNMLLDNFDLFSLKDKLNFKKKWNELMALGKDIEITVGVKEKNEQELSNNLLIEDSNSFANSNDFLYGDICDDSLMLFSNTVVDNKIRIESINDFINFDSIEKKFYIDLLNNPIDSNNIHTLKASISRLLVRNGDIDSITKLGNGVDYSLENKSLEDIIDLLSTINELTNINDLKNILSQCVELIGTEELNKIRDISINIKQQLANEYRRGYINSFTNYNERTVEELTQIDGIVAYEEDGMKIVELKGAPFAFLAHRGPINGSSQKCCCSEITEDNITLIAKTGEYANPYIFSNFSPNRIKIINIEDAGIKADSNQYIQAKDLVALTQQGTEYNEVSISTNKEYGDDALCPDAILLFKENDKFTNGDVDSIANLKTKDFNTIYILHKDIYEKKQNTQKNSKEELLQNYFSNALDSDILNSIMLASGGINTLEMNKMLEEIRNQIGSYLEEATTNKKNLRRNLSRYCQLSKNQQGKLPFDIKCKIEEKLQQLSNSQFKENSNLKDVLNNIVNKSRKESDKSDFDEYR